MRQMVRVGIGEGAAGTGGGRRGVAGGGSTRGEEGVAGGNRESGGPPWDAESDLKEGRK